MSDAYISPQILQWARLRSNIDIENLANKLTVKSEQVLDWEAGKSLPTFKQAQKLANVLRVPFGYLFLQQPPVEELPLQDLRTVNDRFLYNYSIDLREIISDVIKKIDWYRDYLKEQEAEPLSFIGKYKMNEEVDLIAQNITQTLSLTIDDRISVSGWQGFFKLLIERAENIGILVMCSGKVGNNTHRVLDVNEFRGFAISDPLAPAIFINGADAKAAQIFTLIHELAHLWFGLSGVSDLNLRIDNIKIQNVLEIKCNEVAAEVLVPKSFIIRRWQSDISLTENIEILCKLFKVSSVVIARRALDLNYITFDEFYQYYQMQVEIWKKTKEQKESGGNFYKNLPIANSRKFSNIILQEVYSQNLLMRDGARLLGINAALLERFAREVGFIQ